MKTVFFIATLVVLLIFSAQLKRARKLTDAKTPKDMPAFASHILSSINALLVANLGALLGIAVTERAIPGQSAAAQLLAAMWYLVAMVFVFFYWSSKDFEEDKEKIVAAIPELGRSSMGVLLAIFVGATGIGMAML